MTPFELLALVVTTAAAIGWANERWVGLPTVIGVTLGGMITSLALLALGQLDLLGGAGFAQDALARLDFDQLLLHGLLGALLFAGALEVDLGELTRQRASILVLSTVGVVVSTLLVGVGGWALLGALGIRMSFLHALLFGALISPTDPIAVLALLRRAGAPPELETLIAGESLFNDGVGVVVFTIVLGLLGASAEHGGAVGPGLAFRLFVVEALGGILFGLALGYGAYLLLKEVDAPGVEILITLCLVTGGYALAGRLHTSGPLAMVVAGLMVGNQGRAFAMSERTRERLDVFWVVVDEVLNAVLFVIVGLELVVLELEPAFLWAGLLAIPLVLAARLATVGAVIGIHRVRHSYRSYTIRIMTWGGLRGGIAVALALSIPPSRERDLFLVMTYFVVVFSIIVQGLTVEKLARLANRAEGPREAAPGEL